MTENEMILGTVHRYPGTYLTTEESNDKPKLGDRVMKAIWPVIASNLFPYLKMRLVESYRT